MKLLTRDNFRESVFERDGHLCVICKEAGVDAHHIIERRLFSDGGYYLDNGATLCSKHHLLAESTELSCETIRSAAFIQSLVLPEHFYHDIDYDKWGNIIMPNGTRVRGELFSDVSVQKVMKPVLGEFTKYVKYPRTYHLPWSNLLKDDRMMEEDSDFEGKEVVVTIKMDGENSTLYNDYIHARSINSGNHPSRNWLKGLWSQISYLIDDDMRICGENLYAVHSLKYENLESYFNVFSIWTDMTCLSWKETVEYAGILGLRTVPVIYEGAYDRKRIIKAFADYDSINKSEGYVIRWADEFNYCQFRSAVGKFVKPEFRQAVNNSHGHWISKKIEVNKLYEPNRKVKEGLHWPFLQGNVGDHGVQPNDAQ